MGIEICFDRVDKILKKNIYNSESGPKSQKVPLDVTKAKRRNARPSAVHTDLKCGCMMSETWGILTVALKSDFMMKSSGRVIRFRSSNRLHSEQCNLLL